MTERVSAIIQARMSSNRLPGKVLLNVRGKPLLGYLLERLGRCAELQGVAIATSTDISDDPIGEFAKHRDVPCYRGPLEDVASRMLTAARAEGCQAFARISGDSPLIDPELVDTAVRIYRLERVDLVTNVQKRTFPKGQSVEVVAVRAMVRACEDMTTDAEREHVTPYFYSHSDRFRIANFTSKERLGQLQLSVDTNDDLKRFETILGYLEEPFCQHGLESVVRAAKIVDAKRAHKGH